jgi:nucleotide-binding universal stress UspA family protein
MYHRILIALQGKETDQAVVSHVKDLAVQTGAELVLLRVIGVADDGGGGLGKQFQLETGSNGWRRKRAAEEALPRLAGQLQRQGLRVTTAVVVGTRSEADEIVAYAAENDCDLIAMASDSRPWYKRWLAGSPAGEVLREATVPTLFVGESTRRVPAVRVAPVGHPIMAILGSAEL